MRAPPRVAFTVSCRVAAFLVLVARVASGEVVGIDVLRRDDAGTHERVIARVHYAVDPALPANQSIADLSLAPRNAEGRVEFAGDLLLFLPKSPASSRGTVFLEVVNRGRDQSLGLMSDARQSGASPERWNLGDRFLLEQGFTVAFLGWQFDVTEGLGLTVPTAPVSGIVRTTVVTVAPSAGAIALPYCAADPRQADASLTSRTIIDGPSTVLPRTSWQFSPDGCTVRPQGALETGLTEVIYRAVGSPVAGLGLAAVRDFASYLKHGGSVATLRETPALMRRVIGFGYSQSGRFLREFVRDGFNADERGRAAFDALMISAAGAGGGSFNHRFAMPGQAGNSVLSVLRPVDLPPFTDEGLLARSRGAGVTPKIFYTFSSTEYWARAGSLTHTTEDGKSDAPLAATSRLYFLAGTPHASGALRPMTVPGQAGEVYANFAQQRWVLRALLLALDDWTARGIEPPASQYPSIARGELVPRSKVRFPAMPQLQIPGYMPQVWRMDFGDGYQATRVITNEPPRLGTAFPVLVPQVNDEGNDVAGIRMPEVAVPLGTYTAWLVPYPELSGLGYLSGLSGAFVPFAATRDGRQKGDTRLSIEERYRGKQDYLDRVKRSASELVRARFMRAGDTGAVLERAEAVWNAVVGN
jgi:hypothetical protein